MKKLLILLMAVIAAPLFSLQAPIKTEFSYLPMDIKKEIANYFFTNEPVDTIAKKIVAYFSANRQLRTVWNNQRFVNDLIKKLAYYDANKRGYFDFKHEAYKLPRVPTVLAAIKNLTDLDKALKEGDAATAKKLIEEQDTPFDDILLRLWEGRSQIGEFFTAGKAQPILTLVKAGVNPNYQITTVGKISTDEPKIKVSLLALALALFAESTKDFNGTVGRKSGDPQAKNIVKELIKLGALVNEENYHKPYFSSEKPSTLLDLAQATRDAELIKLFKDAGTK